MLTDSEHKRISFFKASEATDIIRTFAENYRSRMFKEEIKKYLAENQRARFAADRPWLSEWPRPTEDHPDQGRPAN